MNWKPVGAAVAAAAILLVSSLTAALYKDAPRLQAQASSENLPPLPGSVGEQLREDALIEMTAFDEKSPSLVHPEREATEDHNQGQPHIELDEAIKSASDGSGLDPGTAVAATLVMVTPTAYGFPVTQKGDDEPSSVLPIYDGTASWAIEFDGVSVPHGAYRGGLKDGDTEEQPSYTTNMIVFVDAYTSDYMLGAQYDGK